MPCLCRWCDVSHLGHCTESSTLHCCFMFRGVLWVFSSLCFSYAEFTLQDYSPDFPLHILQIAYTKASRSEASGHLLSALKLVLDRYVWAVERCDPLACRTISRRLNIWLCRGQMREPCNELQPMRTGKGCGGKGVEKERQKSTGAEPARVRRLETTQARQGFLLVKDLVFYDPLSLIIHFTCKLQKVQDSWLQDRHLCSVNSAAVWQL